ncbi:5'-methylthioadenosine phosphorylase [Achromatium sp. WMS2]|nr:5'-methylthioadenosine phosphorylase [Achromatium sp. WMS2]
MLAVIGGSGFTSGYLEVFEQNFIHTPFGEPSGPIITGQIDKEQVLFVPRHGSNHSIPPHQINYRANIWALQQCGAKQVVAVAAVGGIHQSMGPLTIVIPDQIIDYTYGRKHTFFERGIAKVEHIDFSYPYREHLRQQLIGAANRLNIPIINYGTYGATQGPRLETVAEIKRMEQDGCHIVGMTGMPEAALARELNLDYASCALVVNWAAGKDTGIVELSEIERNLKLGMDQIYQLLAKFITINKC